MGEGFLFGIIMTVIIYCLVKLFIRPRSDINYAKARPEIIEMEKIRADIDSIDEFLSDIETVKRSNNMEIFVHLTYLPLAGGVEKSLRMPISINADNLTVLASEEKQRLKGKLEKPMRKVHRIIEKVKDSP